MDTLILGWKETLMNSPVNWLLEESNPSIRYFTLRDVLDQPEDDPKTIRARNAICESAFIKRVLSKQRPDGFWLGKAGPYFPKYKSSYWSIMLLSQLGMHKSHPKVEKACEYIFQFQQADGAFSAYSTPTAEREHERLTQKDKNLILPRKHAVSLIREHEYSCLTGNMVAALSRMGYTDDARVKKAITLAQRSPKQGWRMALSLLACTHT
jgi:hypothetical protein